MMTMYIILIIYVMMTMYVILIICNDDYAYNINYIYVTMTCI